MSRLDGQVALITGAARGIGRAIAARFADEGARLVLVDVTPFAPEDVPAPAATTRILTASVADEDTLARAVALAVADFGRLDILVNNAFATVHKSITELTADEWRLTLDVSLTAVFYACKHAIPIMQAQGGGAIVNLSSVNSLVAAPGMPAYTAAKGGVAALTRQLAVEYGPYGIRANAIRPGTIATEYVLEGVLADPVEAQATVDSCPLRRVGTPVDIANAALFLASDEASFINGVVLVVDGGTSVQWPAILVRPGLRRKMRLGP